MRIYIETCMPVDSYILRFTYAGIHTMVPLVRESNSVIASELQEKSIAALMNLCIVELRDIKQQKVLKHEADAGKIKFIGVDY